MSKLSKAPSIRMPTLEEDKAITAAANTDPDAKPLTAAQLKAMVPLRALRGRPKSENPRSLFATARKFLRTSRQQERAGNRAWMVCSGSTSPNSREERNDDAQLAPKAPTRVWWRYIKQMESRRCRWKLQS